jgi:hypothetical protein
MPISIIYTAAFILVVGSFSLPYGYYVFLRLVVTCVFIWAAVVAHGKDKTSLMWVCIGLVMLFNPIFKVHLTNNVWGFIDILSAVFLIGIRGQIKLRVNTEKEVIVFNKLSSIFKKNGLEAATAGIQTVHKAVETCRDVTLRNLNVQEQTKDDERASIVLTALLVNNLPKYKRISKEDLMYGALATAYQTKDMDFIQDLYNHRLKSYMTNELLSATNATSFKDQNSYANSLVSVYGALRRLPINQ